MRLRTGTRLNRNLYLQTSDEPNDLDPLVGSCADPHIAKLIVSAVNYCCNRATITEHQTVQAEWNRVGTILAETAALERAARKAAREAKP